jgi:membrane dipeptidase
MASHSNLRSLCDIPRNMSDDMIRALARQGGVIFINFNVPYLDRKAYDIFAANRDQRDREIADIRSNPRRWELRRAIQKRYKALLPPVDAGAVLRQIDHVVKIAGPDHVGIGSDYDGISGMAPKGLEDVSRYPALVRGMIEKGYPDEHIRKIAGGNLLRVMRAAEAAAEK